MADRHKYPLIYVRPNGTMHDEIENLHAKYAKDNESKHSFIRRGLRFALDHYREWVKK